MLKKYFGVSVFIRYIGQFSHLKGKWTYIPFLYSDNFIAFQTVIQELRIVRDDKRRAHLQMKCRIAAAWKYAAELRRRKWVWEKASS